ncbi:MAG TPA: TetR/AcrR family transcriptional regulator [Syntrophales bacterium]|nr:TetR/AcrR family transcriptional regulator [Syntrophales bacterium]HOM06641.1 TetR/AcrR family transcriptional regulator [Syntrophales bacterium]HON99791.1 TetR/AcrR family transcriptional regulator [Syntrophales bacterium]HPC01145.1 TetR/AcrR family transcriptional regulator [Syntrophales bacterium]HPQ06302.1 TetR/AcrR family transcriptional regulator [Syntrophales bacterium]
MGIKERRLREKNNRIRQLKESAAVVFREKGFAGATMEEVARRAEVSKAAIYLYFRSKEDLYYSLIEPALNRLSQKLIQLAASPLPPEEKVKAMAQATYEFYEADPDAYHLVARYKAQEFDRLLTAEKLNHLRNLMKSNLYQVEKAIAEGIEAGVFKAVDAKLTSIIIWNAFMGVIQFQENRMAPGRRDYRRSTLEAALEMILAGIKAPRG